MEPNQQQENNQPVGQQAPVQPQPQQMPVYQESPQQKILREGTTVLSLVAMFTAFMNLFKNIFRKK